MCVFITGTETEEVTFVVSVGTADYCGQVVANVDIFGVLHVFSDVGHTTEKNVWNHFLRSTAYFMATFTSPTISTFVGVVDTVTATIHSRSGWVNTVTLYSAGVVTALGTTVEFAVPAPNLVNVYFEFDVARLFDTLAAPINSTMTVTAMVGISFSDQQHKRSLEFTAQPLRTSSMKRFAGGNSRTLRTDVTLFFGAEEDRSTDSKHHNNNNNNNPLLGPNRDGEQQEAHQEPGLFEGFDVSSVLAALGGSAAVSNILTNTIALLVIAVLVLVVIKQVRNL